MLGLLLLWVLTLNILSISNFTANMLCTVNALGLPDYMHFAQIPNISDKLGRRRLGKVKRGRGCLLLPGTPPPIGRLGTLLPPIGRLPGTGTPPLGRLEV